MTKVSDLCTFLENFAPSALAESWDNVGLIIGDPEQKVCKVMTCLTITPESAAEAIEEQAQLIVTHHPLPFRPLQRITTLETPARLVWELAGAKISVYSPHTAFDSTHRGINAQLAEIMELVEVVPIRSGSLGGDVGAGRMGHLHHPITLAQLVARLRRKLNGATCEANFGADHPVQSIAIACGSGGSLLAEARRLGCDCFVTGEASFHTVLEASAGGMALLQIGHFTSERFAVEHLAELIQQNFADCSVWASRRESFPRHWL